MIENGTGSGDTVRTDAQDDDDKKSSSKSKYTITALARSSLKAGHTETKYQARLEFEH